MLGVHAKYIVRTHTKRKNDSLDFICWALACWAQSLPVMKTYGPKVMMDGIGALLGHRIYLLGLGTFGLFKIGAWEEEAQ